VRLRDRDDHAVEWIPVQGRQRSRRARNTGIQGNLAQIALDYS
jgi:hypothetical protein